MLKTLFFSSKNCPRKASEIKRMKSEKSKLHQCSEIESKKERSRPWRQTRPYSCRSRSSQVVYFLTNEGVSD